jgi:hypothetical protein
MKISINHNYVGYRLGAVVRVNLKKKKKKNKKKAKSPKEKA